MNTANLKAYAPKARRDFIAAVSKQAEKYGVTAKAIHPVQTTGDVCVVNGRPFPSKLAPRIRKLGERVKRSGFEQTMEQVAYSWFNRIIAIRYMELHDYLGHGRRVLSHPEHATGFQILDECTDITYGQGGQLPHLSHAKVVELKLDGTKDEELYRELLLAQCHALHQAMPFLFETVDDETELLLPENLTKTDSLLHELVTEIPEADWANIEIIGWLYQFYISEKKELVIGKLVKSEDIPAATQLFTPNWIVKYMVQNTLGSRWLETYPNSSLRELMEYYIKPAEQTDEVNALLKATKTNSLNPEELTLIDPASGSGHILVEAYELFKAIYLERGYRLRDIAQLILENNLFGLDIDERAAQLTGFALMMKGREDDRKIFDREIKLNVISLKDSSSFDIDDFFESELLSNIGLTIRDLSELKVIFENASTLGALINIPEELKEKLPLFRLLSQHHSSDIFINNAIVCIRLLVRQLEFLSSTYDVVIANPPYMGGKYHNPIIKNYLKENYSNYNKDLFSAFMVRNIRMSKFNGINGFVTPFVWLSIASYESVRNLILDNFSINSLVKPSYTSFFESAIVSLVTFVIDKRTNDYNGTFFDLGYLGSAESQPIKLKSGINSLDCDYKYSSYSSSFKAIPGSPIAFGLSDRVRELFSKEKSLDRYTDIKTGMQTGDNERFLRFWYEVSFEKVSGNDEFSNQVNDWHLYSKGGDFRKWYGNVEHVVDWKDNGLEIKNCYVKGSLRSRVREMSNYYRRGASWSFVSSSYFGVRYKPPGIFFDVAGSSALENDIPIFDAIGFLCSKLASMFLKATNPTANIQVQDISNLPFIPNKSDSNIIKKLVSISKLDWDSYESSWGFGVSPLLAISSQGIETICEGYNLWVESNKKIIDEVKTLEEHNNRLFIEAYSLTEELTSDISIEEVTLTVNPAYRYRGKLTEEKLWTRFREDTVKELISYAIGCMMGRYSLDSTGLIYANSGNESFDSNGYTTFLADNDGIVPLTDAEWYSDDATNRLVEFISVAWNSKFLEDNIAFIAANLSPKKGEVSRDTIRRYLCDRFYLDHIQTYKKRPIYWLFSSGKQKTFQCLVYLHRYNEGTLARMRTEYVIPLTAKLSSHIDKLDNDKLASDSTAEIKKLEKEIICLQKQQTELTEFDEKLKHLADQRIKLDLDDGVKVNYGKFGDLLAEVKAIHGKVV